MKYTLCWVPALILAQTSAELLLELQFLFGPPQTIFYHPSNYSTSVPALILAQTSAELLLELQFLFGPPQTIFYHPSNYSTSVPASSKELLLYCFKEMCHSSPAKILRDVMRMTKYNENKSSKLPSPTLSKPLSMEILPQINISPTLSKPALAIENLPQIDVPPLPKVLSYSSPTFVAISPMKRNLSRCNQLSSESVPGLLNEDEQTISTYIDGFSHQTIFICKVCNTDHYRSTLEIKKHQREVHRIVFSPRMNYPFESRFECIS